MVCNAPWCLLPTTPICSCYSHFPPATLVYFSESHWLCQAQLTLRGFVKTWVSRPRPQNLWFIRAGLWLVNLYFWKFPGDFVAGVAGQPLENHWWCADKSDTWGSGWNAWIKYLLISLMWMPPPRPILTSQPYISWLTKFLKIYQSPLRSIPLEWNHSFRAILQSLLRKED